MKKHWIPLAAILLLGGGAIFLAERRKADAPVSPASLLYFLADTQRELTRLPASATRLSDADEIRAGQQMARRYNSQYQQKKNAEAREVETYVRMVGIRVAVRAHRKLPYSFHYIPDPDMINAFSLPGGPVFIGEGLMMLMDSEDELASVLGHELEHIDHYHCAERLQIEARTRQAGIFGILAELPIEVFAAGYSKDQELEADREGTRLAVQAGYSPTGALRMFETFDRLFEEHIRKARTPQEELTSVALQTLSGYFRSHPAMSDRSAQIRRMMEAEHWPIRPERDLEVAYIFRTIRARKAMEARRYDQARKLAEQALQARPDNLNALRVLAQAQWATADFAGAAATDRRVLDLSPTQASGYDYAHALAAAGNPARAVREFEQWMNSSRPLKDRGLEVPLAGLKLLAGDPAPAKAAVGRAKASAEFWAPGWLGDLGWWYYRAGQYQTAAELLNSAVQQRPGDTNFVAHLGWANIELHNYRDALSNFQAGSEPLMGRAVTLWLAQRQDEALSSYAQAATERPEWTNPRWVSALYSPLVARTVANMKAEQERRSKKPPVRAGNP